MPVDSVACEAEPSYIYPFLEGEPIQFAYSRIGKGVVESSSNKFKLEMMTELMKADSSKCANAVVGMYMDDVFKKENMVSRPENPGFRVLQFG
jgi:hypothetical protein